MGITRLRQAFLRARFLVLPPLFVAALGASLALWGQHTRDATAPAAGETSDEAATTAEKKAARTSARRSATHLREGTEIRDVTGRFHIVDGRFEFASTDGKYRLRMLENLALERAARKAGETPQALVWKVSGVVTEYENANYLLVRRVVVADGAAE